MPRPSLTSARIDLVPMTSEHLPFLVELDSDPEVLRFILGRARTEQEVHDFWAPICADTTADVVGLGWWIGRRRSDGAFLGWWDLSPQRPVAQQPVRAKAGWRLQRRHWGLGYATEAARVILQYGFSTVGLEVVYAETMAVNLASRAVMSRLGMHLVRTEHRTWDQPLDGAEHGEVVYEIDRERWVRPVSR